MDNLFSLPRTPTEELVTNMSAKVFISYSRRDFRFVRDLALDLREAGMNPWLDVTSIRGSERWNSRIQSALQECAHFLLVVSPYSLKSPHVQRELRQALEDGKPIVPVLLQTTDLGEQLGDIEYIDFRVDYTKAFATLVSLLRGEDPQLSDWLDIPPKPTSNFLRIVPLFYIPCPRSVKVISTLIAVSTLLKMMIAGGAIFNVGSVGSGGAFFSALIAFFSALAMWQTWSAANRRVTFGDIATVPPILFLFSFFPLLAAVPIWEFLITTPLDCVALVMMFRSKSFRRWMIAYPYGLGAKN